MARIGKRANEMNGKIARGCWWVKDFRIRIRRFKLVKMTKGKARHEGIKGIRDVFNVVSVYGESGCVISPTRALSRGKGSPLLSCPSASG